MTSSRGVSRIFGAATLAAVFCLGYVTISKADDDAPKKHVKTLQERILEVQAGANLLEKKAPKTLAGPDLSDREKVVQVLNRMAFGPTPGEVDEVLEKGLSRYIKEQLDPEKIDDSECEKTVAARYPWMKMTMAQLDEEYGYQRGPNKKKPREGDESMHSQFPTLVLTRSVMSKRQFKEVMCEFWRNHFCVDQPTVNEEKSRTATDPDYEENVVRKFVFGNFKDMLYASARHPAMLEYLDNRLSKRNEWNENYAREVMELHTVGADHGYSNLDVQELSKVLTGWGYDDNFAFHFSPDRHQPGPKHWLGMTIPEGYNGGEEALYTLAMHANTATFIAEKLCKYLINDTPSPRLVKTVAGVFRDSKGNLPKVYSAVLNSPDFMSRDNYRAKFKSPFYFTVSALRATSPKLENLLETTRRIAKMGEPIYNCPDPTGYRDVAESWMDAGVLTSRWQFAWDLMRGDISGLPVGDAFLGRYKSLKPEEVESKMIEDLIGGDVGDRELTALKDVAAAGDWPRMASIILGSPSFQQR